LPSFTVLTQVIPDSKTIRKRYFIRRRAHSLCITDIDYTGTDSRTKAQCTSTGDFPNV